MTRCWAGGSHTPLPSRPGAAQDKSWQYHFVFFLNIVVRGNFPFVLFVQLWVQHIPDL